jgi:RNA polymerase sigma factor (sigma-70 family)
MSPFSLRRLSDERLSGRLASGEAAAFDELYRRYVHRLAAYGAQLLGDPSAGEDVAHVALLNAYQALRGGRLPERVRPWLYRIAHNAALDTLPRRRELPSAEVRAAEEEPARDQPAVRGALLDAVAALPERQRRAYVLRELHGLKVTEIAAELSLEAPQVEQALFSARNRLAELLVFGERLSCAAARRLSEGPLEWGERKALRSHARSCPACRAALGRRASALGALPALDWLRDLAFAGAGGGGVAAAKVGAVAATATLVAGLPAAHDLAPRSGPDGASVAQERPAAVQRAVPLSARPLAAERAASTRAPRLRGGHGGHREGSSGRGGDEREARGPEGREQRGGEEGRAETTRTEAARTEAPERSGSSGRDGASGPEETVPATAPSTGTTATEGGNEGSGSGSGGLELTVDADGDEGPAGTTAEGPEGSGGESGSGGGEPSGSGEGSSSGDGSGSGGSGG